MRLLGVSRTDDKAPGIPHSLGELSDQLSIAFHVYRLMIGNELKAKEAIKTELTAAILNEIHDRLTDFWGITFTPTIREGYRIHAKELSDDFVTMAAGKYSGQLAKQINEVSDRAFVEGYNAALNKGWDRAVAWQKVSDAWGLDPVQMRSWISYYPQDGYHPQKHPDKAARHLEELLGVRAERISEHEARTVINLGRQAEWTAKAQEGLLPRNLKKVFRTAQDELVCSTCGPLDGNAVGINDEFSGFFMPPLHINCRCQVILEFDADSVVKSEPLKRSKKPLSRKGKAKVQYEVPEIQPTIAEPEQKPKEIAYETPEIVEGEYETKPATKPVAKPVAKPAAKPIAKPAVRSRTSVAKPRAKTRLHVRNAVRAFQGKEDVDPREALQERLLAQHAARQRQVEQWRSEVRRGVRQQRRQTRLGNTDWAQVNRSERRYNTTDNPNRQYVSKRLRMKYGSG